MTADLRFLQVCGVSATKHCGRCAKVHYCSPKHQQVAWSGGHKTACSSLKYLDERETLQLAVFNNLFISGSVLPEFDLVLGPDDDDEEAEDEEAKIARDDVGAAQGASTPQRDADSDCELPADCPSTVLNAEELEVFAARESSSQKMLRRFKAAVASAPDQVLRYHRGGAMLQVREHSMGDVPSCERCGAPRQAEMQVLPQLLNHLKVDSEAENVSPDWASIRVYTCSASCSPDAESEVGKGDYRREYLVLEHFD